MNSIDFTVYAVPVAQPRQRHRIIQTKGGKLFAHNYTPKRDPVNAFKFMVKQEALHLMADRLGVMQGPLGFDLLVYLPRSKKFDAKKYGHGAIWHSGQKDFDNLAKSVTDALQGIVFNNDGQICWAVIKKYYHERGGKPRVEISIRQLEQ